MKKSQVLILVIAISAITLIGRDIIDRYALLNISHAQSAQSRGPTRWEYCALKGSLDARANFGSTVWYVTIHYYQPSGFREVMIDLDESRGGKSVQGVIGKAITMLGDEGWEMVTGRSEDGDTSWIYFKRPKQ
jgi:hypothetical protein